MTVIGCDVSSFAVDLVALHDDTDHATWHRYPLTGPTPFARARSLREVFPTRSWFEDQGAWLFGLEDPHSRFPHVAKALGLVTGAVAALLPAGLTVVQTTPNEWKQEFCGKASASKPTVGLAALARGYCLPDWPQDAYDALGIAWAVRELNQRAIDKGAAA